MCLSHLFSASAPHLLLTVQIVHWILALNCVVFQILPASLTRMSPSPLCLLSCYNAASDGGQAFPRFVAIIAVIQVGHKVKKLISIFHSLFLRMTEVVQQIWRSFALTDYAGP